MPDMINGSNRVNIAEVGMNRKQQPINNISFVRMLGMFMIFIGHSWGLLPCTIPDLGARGVDLFFILSGFLLTYNHYYDYEDIPVIKGAFLGICRVFRFYPLHVVTALAFLAEKYYEMSISGERTDITKGFVINLLLVQSWIPNSEYYFGFNGVSWFLSSLVFCYAVFPLILRFIKKIERKGFMLQVAMLLLFAVEIFQTASNKWEWFERDYYLYIFPPFRAIVFCIGGIFGAYFVLNQSNICSVGSNWKCLTWLLLYISSIFLCNNDWRSAMYLPIEVLTIYIIASQSCENRSFFNNKITHFFSDISFEFFLIHHMIIVFWSRHCWGLFKNHEPAWYEHIFWMFTLSVLLSLLYHKTIHKSIKR